MSEIRCEDCGSVRAICPEPHEEDQNVYCAECKALLGSKEEIDQRMAELEQHDASRVDSMLRNFGSGSGSWN